MKILFQQVPGTQHSALFDNHIIIIVHKYLTIIRRRRGDYREIFAPRRSPGEYSPIITEPEANNCFSIFVFFGTEFILISLISLSV